jgi:hypothetical protein
METEGSRRTSARRIPWGTLWRSLSQNHPRPLGSHAIRPRTKGGHVLERAITLG